MTAAVPPGPIPPVVLAEASGATVTPVWLNDAGGVTYVVDDARSPRFVKWQPHSAEISLRDEAIRMRWAVGFLTVPEVVSHGSDTDGQWLVTTAIPARSAVADEWIARPAVAVAAVGRGLRALHEALPVAQCPWSWAPAERIEQARDRGIRVPADLESAPSVDRLVVCHGDPCCPNTLLGDDGNVAGHVDLGSLGVADRWADITVAAMSTLWNYGPGWSDHLLAAYGVAPDAVRMDYYQRLWDNT
ncbi:aminoglycoside 3'-phosphotransferase [Williamsia phyllosphaerae]|uniref:Phosphotransferase n=1 Tax=Williamsia phyllosphaerae TaxID=885042 RepID=A0ABQ1V7A6_9NOCA|nr:aminoglycoside 3'-phosphotransferase [Williamsia phyllosphaerae]GGF42015.1 putative phosphotransferase [Williamsia phyllosphaerae]